MKKKIDKDTANNLAIFLDRVTIKGFDELALMNEILKDLDQSIISQKNINFLVKFLSQISITGLKEITAINIILSILKDFSEESN